MQQLDTSHIVAMLHSISQAMSDKREYLIELDSAIGDGDLGITMEKGFKAAYEYAVANPQSNPGDLLMRCGMQIVKTAPSTMGTLMGSGFMRGGKAIGGKETLVAADIHDFFAGFLQGVLERGKAKEGEKTIVDILVPMVAAMKGYEGTDILKMLERGVEGAHLGLEQEQGMMSQHGKAAVFREKTKDMIDPGSMAVVILIEACAAGLAKE
jgi:dihydroxyacetone kinase-like protein